MRWIVVAALAACSGRPPVESSGGGAVLAPPDAARELVHADRRVIASWRGVCVRLGGGDVQCWGEVGRDVKLSPVPIGIADAAGLASTDVETCAWRGDGRVACWGLPSGYRPEMIEGLTGVEELAASTHDAWCARRGGAVACWHHENVPTTMTWRPPVPKPVVGLVDAVELAVAGDLACARRAAGAVACWRIGSDARPTEVPAARGAIAIAGHRGKLAAVLGDGKGVAWDEQLAPWELPIPATGLARVAIGDLAVCGIATGGTVTCAASSATGYLPAAPVPDLADAAWVTIGKQAACARTTRDAVRCWGRIDALGAGLPFREIAPVEVDGLADAVHLAASAEMTCARRANGRVACWGRRSAAPRDAGVERVVELGVSGEEACARRADRSIVCWGGRWDAPTEVPRALFPTNGTPSWAWHSSFRRYTIDCTRKGRALACTRHIAAKPAEPERTERYQLLDGADDVLDLILPTEGHAMLYVLRASGAVERSLRGEEPWSTTVKAGAASMLIEAGFADRVEHTEVCALRRDGQIGCWPFVGGDELLEVRLLPGLHDATQLVGAAGSHGCALRHAGRVACWGHRDMLGDGGSAALTRPLAIPVQL